MTSWTSPRASAYGLPISRVTTRASASLLSSTSRPACWIARPRTGAGTAAHAGCAARAASHAATNVDASPSATPATTSSVRAGFVEATRPPGAPSGARPATIDATVGLAATVSVMTTTVTPRLALMPLRQVLVLLALGALLAAAAPARAAAPGINIAYVESARGQVARATQTGARYARLFVLWSDFQPAGPRQSIAGYRLTQYDDAVARLRRAGARPIFSVVGAPRWANGSADRLVPPSDPAAYARFLGALARHFRGRVAAYEVWNEEDEPFFWHAPVDAGRYAALLRAGFGAVRRADRRAKVLVGPLTGNNYGFLQALYRAGIKR